MINAKKTRVICLAKMSTSIFPRTWCYCRGVIKLTLAPFLNRYYSPLSLPPSQFLKQSSWHLGMPAKHDRPFLCPTAFSSCRLYLTNVWGLWTTAACLALSRTHAFSILHITMSRMSVDWSLKTVAQWVNALGCNSVVYSVPTGGRLTALLRQCESLFLMRWARWFWIGCSVTDRASASSAFRCFSCFCHTLSSPGKAP